MTRHESSGSTEIDDLRREISQTREELGATVTELVARTDVKARAKAKSLEVRQRVAQRAKSRGAVLTGAGLAAAAGGAVVVTRVRRARTTSGQAVRLQHGVRRLANSQRTQGAISAATTLLVLGTIRRRRAR